MNFVPIANQREDEQKKRDQEQAAGFRSIDGVPVMLVRRIVWDGHAHIVALI